MLVARRPGHLRLELGPAAWDQLRKVCTDWSLTRIDSDLFFWGVPIRMVIGMTANYWRLLDTTSGEIREEGWI